MAIYSGNVNPPKSAHNSLEEGTLSSQQHISASGFSLLRLSPGLAISTCWDPRLVPGMTVCWEPDGDHRVLQSHQRAICQSSPRGCGDGTHGSLPAYSAIQFPAATLSKIAFITPKGCTRGCESAFPPGERDTAGDLSLPTSPLRENLRASAANKKPILPIRLLQAFSNKQLLSHLEADPLYFCSRPVQLAKL